MDFKIHELKQGILICVCLFSRMSVFFYTSFIQVEHVDGLFVTVEVTAKSSFNCLVFTGGFSTPRSYAPIILCFRFLVVVLSFHISVSGF